MKIHKTLYEKHYAMMKRWTIYGTDEPWWKGIHVIALVGLSARLVLAFVSDYSYHPDEIFQYLEQGHRMVFGYGYIPWEYRFGIRSFIIPGFISLVLDLCKVVSLDDPRLYILVVKTVFCFLSLSLIYSTYVIGRNVASEAAGRLAAVFICLWYEVIFFAHKPTPEVLSTYCLVGALACAVTRPGREKSLLFGLLSGLALALRFQYLPVMFIIGLFVCLVWEKNDILKSGLGFLFVIALAGYSDYLMWGKFFASYYNNYLFNNVYKVSELFGTRKFYFYPKALAIASMGLWCIVGVLSFTRLKKTWLLVLCSAGVLLAHSLIPHKEYRFVFFAVPLLLVLTGIMVSEAVSFCRQSSKKNFICCLALGVIIFLSAGGLSGKLPLQKKLYHHPPCGKRDILQAYTFLYHEPDLAAVAVLNVSKSPFYTGGYYYLHRDIPIYFPQHLTPEHTGKNAITDIVSHIVCPATMDAISGFKAVERIGHLEIRKQIIPPSHYLGLDIDTKDVLKTGIDGTYKSTVKRRF